MPKRRKETRKGASTLKVPALSALMGQRVGSLVVVQGAEADLGRHVVVDSAVTLGRDEEVELPLRDGSISRRHCKVERDGDGYVLVDLGSTNGTVVNAHRVAGRYPLAPGDKIFLGVTVVGFGLSDALDRDYQSKLAEMVSTDPLSGMWVRRQYDASFAEYASRAEAEDRPLAVLVMDLDGLKKINDTHGHDLGSHAIAEVAQVIRAVLEPLGGILCRYGGDEFVAAFSDMDTEEACQVAEELRQRVAAVRVVQGALELGVTVSIGVAVFPDCVEHPAELFTAADQALLRAKREGKDRIALAVDATPP
jgi:two-component system, cell cycle response regulator